MIAVSPTNFIIKSCVISLRWRFAKQSANFFAEGAKSGGKFFWSNIKLASDIERLKRKNLPWPAATRTAACRSAESLNDFFILSVNEIVANLPKPSTSVSVKPSSTSSSCNSLIFHPFTPNDVKKAITELSIVKACGIYNVSVEILRKSSAAIADILVVLFNRSIDADIFPDCFKQALEVPIHKKGDTGKISNY